MSLPIITSPSHCIAVFKELSTSTNLSQQERQLRYSASNYYVNHSDLFLESDIKKLFSFPLFRENLSEKHINAILLHCNKKKSIFPVVLEEWFKTRSIEVERYMNLLYKNKDFDKLEICAKHRGPFISALFNQEKGYPSKKFIDLALKINPENIVNVKDHSTVIEFFNNPNNPIIKTAKIIHPESEQYIAQQEDLMKVVFNALIDFFKKKTSFKGISYAQDNQESDNISFFKNLDINYLKEYENQCPEFLDKIFSQEMRVSTKGFEYECNTLQYICFHKAEIGDYGYVKYCLEQYPDLLKSNIVENVFGYSSHVDVLEYHLRKKQNYFVDVFAQDFKNLNESQKLIVTASLFQSYGRVVESQSFLSNFELLPVSYLVDMSSKVALVKEKKEDLDTLIFNMQIQEALPQKGIKPSKKI